MNFLFSEHNVIFIHLPKNGGTSIRRALGTNNASSAQGIIPRAWGDQPVFAVVRHPLDRFLSGLNMFRLGTPDVDGYYNEPRWPDLTPSTALDILENPAIPYDRRTRNMPANFKHHIWPQTEPFHCLSKVTHLLRFESLEVDFAGFTRQHKIEAVMPHLRKTGKHPSGVLAEHLSPDEHARIERFYAHDFAELGYTPVNPGSLRPPLHITSDPLRAAWRVYFENITFSTISVDEALPDPEVNLAVFAKNRIPGAPGSTWAKRTANPLSHFKRLEPEFAGCLRISHLLACTIVALRRAPTNAVAQHLFHRIVAKFGPTIAQDMNLRWLASVCDTFVDIGKGETDRAIALTGTMLAGTVKLAETERRLFYSVLPWPPRVRFSNGGHLFDGVISFSARRGDMITNMIARCERVLETPSAAAPFVAEILMRLQKKDTVFRRSRDMKGKNPPPLASKTLRAAIRAVLRGSSRFQGLRARFSRSKDNS